MREKEPRHQHQDAEARQPAWPITQLGETLRATPEPSADALLGEGHLFHLGAEQATVLELYPQSGVVRLWGADTFLELTHQAPPHLRRAGVIFTGQADPANPLTEQRRLIVTDQGEALFSLTPTLASAALQGPTTAVAPSDRSFPQLRGETPGSDHPTAPQMPSATPSPRPHSEHQETEQRPRVTLSGRVGKAPALRTTRNGVLIARFPLAVHSEEGETAWHQIVAFNKKAAQVQDALSKGQVVEVIGYLHEREQKTRDGKTKRVQEIYAAVVKPR